MNIKENKALKDIFTEKLKTIDQSRLDNQLLMFRFLSEIEKITDDRKISRRKLADMVGTSPSYITQLYQGNKIINIDLICKMQKALDIKFEITAIPKCQENQEKEYHAFFFEKPQLNHKVRHTSIKNLYSIDDDKSLTYKLNVKNKDFEQVSA